jgi:hypothetical protein
MHASESIHIAMLCPFAMHNLKVVALQPECPPGQFARVIFGLQEPLEAVMIRDDSEARECQVRMKLLDGPLDCQAFTLCGCIVLLCFIQLVAGVGDNILCTCTSF